MTNHLKTLSVAALVLCAACADGAQSPTGPSTTVTVAPTVSEPPKPAPTVEPTPTPAPPPTTMAAVCEPAVTFPNPRAMGYTATVEASHWTGAAVLPNQFGFEVHYDAANFGPWLTKVSANNGTDAMTLTCGDATITMHAEPAGTDILIDRWSWSYTSSAGEASGHMTRN